IGSTMFFGAMAVMIRLASEALSTYQIAFFRNFFGLIALLPFLWRSGPAVLRTRQWPRYLLRSAIGVGSMPCGFWAIGHLPIVQPGSTSFSLGTLVALSAAVLSAIVAIQIKQLSRVAPADTIVFYTYVFWVPISLVPALFAWEWPQGIAWLWVVAIGAFGTGG